jgi:hypothetical protein
MMRNFRKRLVLLLATNVSVILSLNLANPDNILSRREALSHAAVNAATVSWFPTIASAKVSLAERLESDILTIPAPSYPTELNGVPDNFYFPDFMAGEWSVTQTLLDAKTPLGLKFIGGPNASEKIATDTIKEAQKQIGKPVALRLRYIPTKWGVAEDRLFNARQRLDAFAGKPVVASVEYANVGGSNRQSVLAMGGTENDPLQTTFVRFKGPAAQKTFCISHGSESLDENTWVGYELDRSIFALTNQNTAPPLTTDTEIIWKLEKVDDNHVKGKLRIAGYLNAQSDMLYFDAKKRAVSLQDYSLDFVRA